MSSSSNADRQPGQGSAECAHSEEPMRILMAEDNVINQRVGKLILQRAGFNIDLARTVAKRSRRIERVPTTSF